MVSKAAGAHGLRETVNQAPVGIRTQVPQEDTLECVQDAGAHTQGQICSYVSLYRHAATMAQAGPGFPNPSCLKPTFCWPLTVMCQLGTREKREGYQEPSFSRLSGTNN